MTSAGQRALRRGRGQQMVEWGGKKTDSDSGVQTAVLRTLTRKKKATQTSEAREKA
uniref:Uncharacterized protein n=1 Tax=Anguilla anguilla TaxID=7936 RepID=A0A0E9W7H2_ANGAN